MRLGKFKKELSILLIVGMLSSPVQATEMVTDKQVTSSEQVEEQVQISQVKAIEELDGEEKEIQFMRQHGEAVNVSVVQDNVKVTVEYMIADAYTVKLLMSVEKLDGIPFKASDRLQITGIALSSKEEMERQAIIKAIPEDASLVERLKVVSIIMKICRSTATFKYKRRSLLISETMRKIQV